jgi:perosamine synthetase
MHTFGHPVDMDPLVDVCKRYRLELVEDAAESLGSFYKDRHTGSWGRVSALSFNGNKILTTGGGGAILTNDTALADRAKHLTTTARTQHPWDISHDAVGFNYRLPNLNAALGCAQMEQLPGFVANKRSLAERYRQAFQGMAGIRLFTEPAFAKSNYWLNVLLLEKENAFERDRILELTRTSGMMTRPAWNLMPTLPMYKECPRMDLSTAESIASRLINIPSSAFL